MLYGNIFFCHDFAICLSDPDKLLLYSSDNLPVELERFWKNRIRKTSRLAVSDPNRRYWKCFTMLLIYYSYIYLNVTLGGCLRVDWLK